MEAIANPDKRALNATAAGRPDCKQTRRKSELRNVCAAAASSSEVTWCSPQTETAMTVITQSSRKEARRAFHLSDAGFEELQRLSWPLRLHLDGGAQPFRASDKRQ